MGRIYLSGFLILCLWLIAFVSLGLCVFMAFVADSPDHQLLAAVYLLTFTVASVGLLLYEASLDPD